MIQHLDLRFNSKFKCLREILPFYTKANEGQKFFQHTTQILRVYKHCWFNTWLCSTKIWIFTCLIENSFKFWRFFLLWICNRKIKTQSYTHFCNLSVFNFYFSMFNFILYTRFYILNVHYFIAKRKPLKNIHDLC